MLSIDDRGWIDNIRQIVSKNFNARSESASLIVVHSASLPYSEFANGILEGVFAGTISAATNPELAIYMEGPVSTHILIDRRGNATQFVSFDDRAWHAGVSSFAGREKCNDFSIGIELEGCDYLPYNEAQYVCLNKLIFMLQKKYPIRAVVGHNEITVGRKTDPGELFNWNKVVWRGGEK